MTLIKICGITNLNDAHAAISAGADALGFNFYKPSPRYITPEAAREIINTLSDSIFTVGVFVNEGSPDSVRRKANRAGVKAVQLHGDEPPEYCDALTDIEVIKTFGVSINFDINDLYPYNLDSVMLDTKDNRLRGGTGRVFDWMVAQKVRLHFPKVYLAGGLSPENVTEAIQMVQPYAVDACSSLEDKPGIKNHERMRVFVNKVRGVKP
ncbi:MAG TPA: phosphoribosylanthranilate isomerase [Pyrinomonadaceae bacterium]|nr:phosphoribosylanthranilate isomerase [Pyrinomonadaceae bacterium]